MRFPMSDDEFQECVERALARMPRSVMKKLENVAIFIEDRYFPEIHEYDDAGSPQDGGLVLGLYEGTPLTERTWDSDAGALPDRIFLYQGSILEICESVEQVEREVAITIVHEIAHHFGIDDDLLHELGWG